MGKKRISGAQVIQAVYSPLKNPSLVVFIDLIRFSLHVKNGTLFAGQFLGEILKNKRCWTMYSAKNES